MSDIFISYASHDRDRAASLATAISGLGWSIWWDREIPLGQSFDNVIERALSEAKCVIVLWSAASVASEWVRSEASEGKRRGILIPVFIERVEPPLAFKLMNGADLSAWQDDPKHPELEKLLERVAELLEARPQSTADSERRAYRAAQRGNRPLVQIHQSHAIFAGIAIVASLLIVGGYAMLRPKAPTVNNRPETKSPPVKPTIDKPDDPGIDSLVSSAKGLNQLFGSGVSGISTSRGFHIPELGADFTYLTPEQSAVVGTMPAGSSVVAIESGRPASKAGLQIGDEVISIGGEEVSSLDKLRSVLKKLGPGRTKYKIRRGGEPKEITIDCPDCKAE